MYTLRRCDQGHWVHLHEGGRVGEEPIVTLDKHLERSLSAALPPGAKKPLQCTLG